MLLFYIRHGDPIYDPDSLTPLGKRQAEALSKRLATFGLDKIYASTSTRAKETAMPTAELLKKEIIPCDWAHEGHAWAELSLANDGKNRRWCFADSDALELFSTPEMRALGDKWYTHPALERYGFEKGMKRIDDAVDTFLLSLGYRHDRENSRYEEINENNERVALFAHQGFGMAFFSSMLDIPYPMFCSHFDFSHSSMSVIDFKKRGKFIYPKAIQLSNDSHLYREGILTGYNNSVRF